MPNRELRVLIVEDNAGDAILVETALEELQESSNWKVWNRTFEVYPAAYLAEALDLMGRISFDAILLDLSLPDSESLSTFLRVSERACGSPIVVLAESDDERLAVQLIKAGAQDVLLKQELDCIPLARAMRNAIERNRLYTALQSVSFRDEITGLYSRAAFFQLAGLVRQLHPETVLFAIELDQPANSPPEERLLRRIETADALCCLFGETDILARVAEDRFAALSLDPHCRERLGEQVRAHNLPLRLGVASAVGREDSSVESLLQAAEAACSADALAVHV